MYDLKERKRINQKYNDMIPLSLELKNAFHFNVKVQFLFSVKWL